LPDGILRILIDFLSDRKFFVNINEANSQLVDVERGCPQGSVLGPVLFSLYVGDIMKGLNNCETVSYANHLGLNPDQGHKTEQLRYMNP